MQSWKSVYICCPVNKQDWKLECVFAVNIYIYTHTVRVTQLLCSSFALLPTHTLVVESQLFSIYNSQ